MKTEENKKQEVKELSKEELNTVFGGAAGNNNAAKSNDSDLSNGGEDIGIDEDGVNR
jgi:hypothetical protein